MQYLWDTHTFLWWVAGSSSLSARAREVIEHDDHEPYMSMVSLWEISIKTSLGKLDIAGEYRTVIDDVNENGIQLLPITFPHTLSQHQLPFHHRDPFDRMIIAQAMVEQMPVISADRQFDPYAIERIW
jgi:PIN domain nuclease of toxin-antitoxin system